MRKIIILFIILATKLSGQVTSGLVTQYPFNGNANDNIGNNNGLVNNAVLTTDRFNAPNSAYYFNGINSTINFGDSSEFKFGNSDFNISLWVKFASGQQSGFLTKGAFDNSPFITPNNKGYGIFLLNLNPDAHRFYFQDDNNVNYATGGTAQLDTNWHHISINRSQTPALIVYYLDGAQITMQFIGSNPITGLNYPLVLGSNSFTNEFFKGKIDDIHIYHRVLTGSEINTLYGNFSTSVNSFAIPSINLYPNPTSKSISLIDPNDEVYQVTVIDSNSRVIIKETKTNDNITFTLPSENGSYTVLLEDKNGTILSTKKIIKAN